MWLMIAELHVILVSRVWSLVDTVIPQKKPFALYSSSVVRSKELLFGLLGLPVVERLCFAPSAFHGSC